MLPFLLLSSVPTDGAGAATIGVAIVPGHAVVAMVFAGVATVCSLSSGDAACDYRHIDAKGGAR